MTPREAVLRAAEICMEHSRDSALMASEDANAYIQGCTNEAESLAVAIRDFAATLPEEPASVPFAGNAEEWIRDQVAFYDFIFSTALQMCPKHTKETMIEGFRSGADPYEDAIKAIAAAWNDFPTALAAYRDMLSTERKP